MSVLVVFATAWPSTAIAGEPLQSSDAPGQASELASEQAAEPDEEPLRIELNSASLEELVLLPGIGPKKAKAILELRARRPFSRVTQLLRVHGIGRKTLRRLKPFVFVAPRPRVLAPRAAPVQEVPAPRGTPGQTTEN